MDNLVGARIKQERERLGLSQDELARAVDLGNRSQIHRIETGARRVDSMELRFFSDVLGVSMEAFFDEARGQVLALNRGDDDRMTQWALDLLGDIEFAEAEVAARGW
ncbi:MAG: helix-turn-helix domain-containing protein [Solirubrobacteraceae bacterium]